MLIDWGAADDSFGDRVVFEDEMTINGWST